MKKVDKTTLTMWLVGVMGAGLWLSPCGVALADSSSDSNGQNQQYVQYLQNKLSLTSDQTQQIQSILNNADSQLGPKPDTSTSPADRQAYYQKVQQSMQSAKSSISNVLTDQQKAQYSQLHSQHRGQRQGDANGNNGKGPQQGDWGGRRKHDADGLNGQGPNYQWNSSAQDPSSQQSSPDGQRPWHKHHHHRMDQNDGPWSNNQPNQNGINS